MDDQTDCIPTEIRLLSEPPVELEKKMAHRLLCALSPFAQNGFPMKIYGSRSNRKSIRNATCSTHVSVQFNEPERVLQHHGDDELPCFTDIMSNMMLVLRRYLRKLNPWLPSTSSSLISWSSPVALENV